MARLTLKSSGNAKSFLRVALKSSDIHHLRFSYGDGACLVKHHDPTLVRGFQCLNALNQEPIASTNACANDQCSRSRQSQRTGTCDH